MKWVLDKVGELFVYRSPKPLQGYYNMLLQLPSGMLRVLAGTKAHCKKTKLVDMILTDTKRQCSIQRQYIRACFQINQQVPPPLTIKGDFLQPSPLGLAASREKKIFFQLAGRAGGARPTNFLREAAAQLHMVRSSAAAARLCCFRLSAVSWRNRLITSDQSESCALSLCCLALVSKTVSPLCCLWRWQTSFSSWSLLKVRLIF